MVAALALPVSALAGFRLATVGVGDFLMVENQPADPTVDSTGRLGVGGGLLFEVGLGRQLSLDVGTLYVNRKQVAAGEVASYAGLQVPVVVRIWTNQYLSFGFGGHYTYALSGDVPATRGDYGALASVAVELPITKTVNFVADGRYIYGVADGAPDDDALVIRQNEIQVLVGFRFGESWIKR